jgi:arylsulfatase A
MSRFIACLAALLGFALPAVAEEKKTNIIFILADDLGCFELGCYGQTKSRR